MPPGSWIVFQKSPDVIVHIEDGLAFWEKSRNVIPYVGHARNGNMQMPVALWIQCLFVGLVFLLIGYKDVDECRVDAIVLESG